MTKANLLTTKKELQKRFKNDGCNFRVAAEWCYAITGSYNVIPTEVFDEITEEPTASIKALLKASAACTRKGNVIELPENIAVAPEGKEEGNVLFEIPMLNIATKQTEYITEGNCFAFDKLSKVVEKRGETFTSYRLTFNNVINPLLEVTNGAVNNYDDLAVAIVDGIEFNGYRYVYLISSCSQTRTDGCWFIREDIAREHYLDLITEGLWSKIKGSRLVYAKVQKYLALAFTTATKVEFGRQLKSTYVEINYYGNKSNWNHVVLGDGVLLIADDLLDTPTQVRIYPGVKGLAIPVPRELLERQYGKGIDIVLTQSSLKIGSGEPAGLLKGEIWVVNTFKKDDEKLSSFMHVINMLRPDNGALEAYLERRYTDMERALSSREEFLSFLNQDCASIEVNNVLKELVANNANALKDPVVLDAAKHQVQRKIDELKEGKLPGCHNRVFVPDPMLFFVGKVKNGKLTLTDRHLRYLTVGENEVISDLPTDQVMIMRSPTNMPGQIPSAKNIRPSGYKMLCGITIDLESFYGCGDCRRANVLTFPAISDMPAMLGGADFDGDTGKVAALFPTTMERTEENLVAWEDKYGPWESIFSQKKPFIAVGDTKGKKMAGPICLDALKLAKEMSFVKDNTGIITNNLFVLGDLVATIIKGNDKQIRELLSNKTVTYVLSRMLHNSIKVFDRGDRFVDFDEAIIDAVAECQQYAETINQIIEEFYGKPLSSIWFYGNQTENLAKIIPADLLRELRILLINFLHSCMKIFGHLQMIQIDAGSTGNYPDLDIFNFARIQQAKSVMVDGEQKIKFVAIYPDWFASLKGRRYVDAYESASAVGICYHKALEIEKRLKELKPKTEIHLFSEGINSVAEKLIDMFYNNAYQTETLARELVSRKRKEFGQDKDTVRKYSDKVNSFTKKYLKFKANSLVDTAMKMGVSAEEIAKTAYFLSARAKNSKIRRSAFLTYFGWLVASVATDGSKVLFIKEQNESLLAKVDSSVLIKSRKGDVYTEDGILGKINMPLTGEGILTNINNKWVVTIKPEYVDGIAVSISGIENKLKSIDNAVCQLRPAKRRYQGKDVKVASLIDVESNKELGYVISQDTYKIDKLLAKEETVNILVAEKVTEGKRIVNVILTMAN